MPTHARLSRLSEAANKLNNDTQLVLTHFEMALDLLDQWAAEWGKEDAHLARMTKSLLTRIEES